MSLSAALSSLLTHFVVAAVVPLVFAIKDFVWVPDLNGYFQYIDISVYVHALDPAFEAEKDVFFLLYTRDNPTEGQMFAKDPDVIERTNFNASLPTRFIIHGWLNNYKFEVNTEITAGFLHYGEYNIVS